jgi:two-component system nitrate/nitrite response regulator NarL
MTSVSDAPQLTAPLRVLLVDDQPLFRRAIATLINEQDDLEVVAEAVNGAGRRAEGAQPDARRRSA